MKHKDIVIVGRHFYEYGRYTIGSLNVYWSHSGSKMIIEIDCFAALQHDILSNDTFNVFDYLQKFIFDAMMQAALQAALQQKVQQATNDTGSDILFESLSDEEKNTVNDIIQSIIQTKQEEKDNPSEYCDKMSGEVSDIEEQIIAMIIKEKLTMDILQKRAVK